MNDEIPANICSEHLVPFADCPTFAVHAKQRDAVRAGYARQRFDRRALPTGQEPVDAASGHADHVEGATVSEQATAGAEAHGESGQSVIDYAISQSGVPFAPLEAPEEVLRWFEDNVDDRLALTAAGDAVVDEQLGIQGIGRRLSAPLCTVVCTHEGCDLHGVELTVPRGIIVLGPTLGLGGFHSAELRGTLFCLSCGSQLTHTRE